MDVVAGKLSLSGHCLSTDGLLCCVSRAAAFLFFIVDPLRHHELDSLTGGAEEEVSP
jgi:hypothetical protein